MPAQIFIVTSMAKKRPPLWCAVKNSSHKQILDPWMHRTQVVLLQNAADQFCLRDVQLTPCALLRTSSPMLEEQATNQSVQIEEQEGPPLQLQGVNGVWRQIWKYGRVPYQELFYFLRSLHVRFRIPALKSMHCLEGSENHFTLLVSGRFFLDRDILQSRTAFSSKYVNNVWLSTVGEETPCKCDEYCILLKL